jgi:hypothetical protein
MMTELFTEEVNLDLEELIQELAQSGDYLLD